MKKYIIGFMVCVILVLSLGADRRHLDGRFPVASSAFTQLVVASGATGAGLTQTTTLSNINGVIEQIEIEINTFSNGSETVTVTIASDQDASLYSEASLDDAQTHLKQAVSYTAADGGDFNPAMVDGDLTLTGVLSADPGSSTGTIDVTIFYR